MELKSKIRKNPSDFLFPRNSIGTSVIPANVDPIKLADQIKKDLTQDWIKRRLKIKPLLG